MDADSDFEDEPFLNTVLIRWRYFANPSCFASLGCFGGPWLDMLLGVFPGRNVYSNVLDLVQFPGVVRIRGQHWQIIFSVRIGGNCIRDRSFILNLVHTVLSFYILQAWQIWRYPTCGVKGVNRENNK